MSTNIPVVALKSVRHRMAREPVRHAVVRIISTRYLRFSIDSKPLYLHYAFKAQYLFITQQSMQNVLLLEDVIVD
jgi:hypothetical protein